MKKAFFLIILLVISAAVVTACVSQAPPVTSPSPAPSASPAPALTTVRVAYGATTSNGPLFIAIDEGYFAQQGINVEFEKVLSSATALPLLINGDLDVSAGPVKSGLINAVAKGEHVRIVADKGRVTPGSCTQYALMVRKDLFDKGIVRNVSDLKGRKIAERDSDYDLYKALALGNLSVDDVETVNVELTAVVPAFQNGAIDAGLVTEPYITQALNNGSAVVLVPAQDFLPDWPMPLYYGPDLLDKNPDLGRRFMVAYLQGVNQYNEGKTERNLAIIGNYTHLDRTLLNQSCWYPISADGSMPEKPVRDYIDWMYANKKISQNINDDQLFDMSYAAYASGVLHNTTGSG
jgi:NitT/TauT family transport system substrate-binding protein